MADVPLLKVTRPIRRPSFKMPCRIMGDFERGWWGVYRKAVALQKIWEHRGRRVEVRWYGATEQAHNADSPGSLILLAG